ncbi:hypothetical protein Q9G86_06405 [Bacillus thuringiensis]|uniref:hypothetical protein n=1 Tax=Bacillus cereus group TaxID=86661 RepID=UPI00273C2C8B|nr:hypothetical protein [Bacillus thuringiensis]WLP65384.1 hypothetical protein Q9G86_06405 [Bacillus thuringiensis]
MQDKSYEMSEKAFLEVWKEFGSPNKLCDKGQCYKFLLKLYEKTEGLVIVDHFSYKNYDHISGIELKDNYLYIYWKNFEKASIDNDLVWDVFGNSTYIYSLCDLRELRFINVDNHLFILCMPNVSKVKHVKKILGISGLKEDKEIIIKNNPEKLYTQLKFIKENKIHDCVIHNLPFYSFLLQPKEGSRDAGVSKEILLFATLEFVFSRIVKAKEMLSILDTHDYDEIHSIGNRARVVLESIIKYYCLYFGYSLPEQHYENNMLRNLKKHLDKNDDSDMKEYFNQDVITLANVFSHDNGKVYRKEEVEALCTKVESIINKVFQRVRDK